MTIEIHGRTRYADTPTTKVTIYRGARGAFGDPILVIHGGLIEERNGGQFMLGAKHMTATDDEHDAAYVAYLEGAGLSLYSMHPRGMTLTGVLLTAQFYPEEPEPRNVCVVRPNCDGHGFLPFTPPKQEWQPDLYTLDVEFPGQEI